VSAFISSLSHTLSWVSPKLLRNEGMWCVFLKGEDILVMCGEKTEGRRDDVKKEL
jgi:hypothetical protein